MNTREEIYSTTETSNKETDKVMVQTTEWLGLIECPSGDGEVDITEFDITESDVTFFQEIDITESDVTKKGN